MSHRHDAHGTGAVEAMLKVVARLLAPSESESGGLAIGDLVIALLRKAGDQVLPVLPELLRAMVTRLAAAKTASFSQVSFHCTRLKQTCRSNS